MTGVELVRTSTDDDAFSYLRITDTDGNTFSLDSETQLYDMRGHHYFIVNGDASTTWSDLNI